MKRWMVWSIAGLAAVVAWLLPPEPIPFGEWAPNYTAGALQLALMQEYDDLAEAVWLDTIAARADATPGRILAGVVTQADSVTSDDPHTVVRAELDALGVSEPRVPIGAFWFENELLGPEGRRAGGLPRVLLGDGEDAYCIVTRTRPRNGFWAPLTGRTNFDGRALQGCGFYARYGGPGAHVREWLRGGALMLALDPVGDLRESPGELLTNALPGRIWRGRWEVEQSGCAGGRLDVCSRMFLAPTGDDGGRTAPRRRVVPLHWTATFGPNGSAVLGDLAREFGDQRFEAFWTSSLPVPEAFRAAFGVSHAEWTRTWLLDEYGPVTLGARMSARTVVLTLLAIAFWAAVGAGIARRRRVA